MIYRLLNYIFGLDFIIWSDDGYNGTARVYKNKDGVIFYYRCRSTNDVYEIPARSIVTFTNSL